MQGIIYEESSIWLFLLVTCLMGGWAAWMTGKACASTWRPYPVLAVYLVLLTAAVRFIHFALFGGTLFSAHYFLVDLVVVQAIGALGYRHMRTRQMVSKYRWLYAAAGPFGWTARQ
ncbi:DUF6867 family protein [Methyloraptor flagellatus]|jgi:hypothetical protein|uniref:DUF6867 family protein n=1 Tax=Methyloraptor flagellatus TaxID=3162530 RepID=A0AAU7XCE8_9HYPH